MKKDNVDFIAGIFLIFIGSILIIISHISQITVKTALTFTLSLYIIINFLKYAFTTKSHDYEGLQGALASLITCLFAFFLDINNNSKILALTILIWIILMSLVKLKKADYYHDRSNNLWTLKVFILIFFILLGLLTSINLFNKEIQILILGYFFLTHGLLETIEPLTIHIIEKVTK